MCGMKLLTDSWTSTVQPNSIRSIALEKCTGDTVVLHEAIDSKYYKLAFHKIFSMTFLPDSGNARAVVHVGIANSRFPLESVVGKTVPVFPVHA